MIENIILDYLKEKNLSVGEHVYMEVPENPPEAYIVLEKTGGGREDRIDRAMIAVQSYSKKSLYEAASLNEEIKAAMDEAAQMDEVFSCKLNSDYNYTKPETKEYRYQAVFDLFY